MNNTTNNKRGYIFIFIAGSLWGLIGIFVKEMERCGSTAEMTSFLRILFSFICMLFLCLWKCKAQDLRISARALFTCALLGIFCHGIYNICYSYAVTTIGVSLSAVLLDIAPLFTLLFSVLFFHEKLTVLKALAVVINISGCILTVTNGKIDFGSLALFGLLMGIGAGFFYALTAIIGKLAADETHPFVMSMYSYFFAALFLGLWMRPWANPQPVNTGIILWGLGFAILPTSIAYVIYYAGLQKITESSKVPVIASIEVVVATIIGILLYSEKLGIISCIGIILVLLSIILMSRKPKKPASSEN